MLFLQTNSKLFQFKKKKNLSKIKNIIKFKVLLIFICINIIGSMRKLNNKNINNIYKQLSSNNIRRTNEEIQAIEYTIKVNKIGENISFIYSGNNRNI